jgi:hypothetical protein
MALTLPSADEPWRYAAARWNVSLRALIARRQLAQQTPPGYATSVALGDALHRRWHRVFAAPGAAPLPFQYHQSVGRLLCARVVADLGLHLRQLRHQHHETVHVASIAAHAAATCLQLTCSLKCPPRRLGQKALVDVRTRVQADDGSLLSVVDDSYLTPNLPETALRDLQREPALAPDTHAQHARLPQLHLGTSSTQARWLPVPVKLARAYGRLSGDPVAARQGATGYEHAVLPALGLRNLALSHLADLGLPLNRLQMTFTSPAYLRRTLTLLAQPGRFELHDPIGRVVAHGECSD